MKQKFLSFWQSPKCVFWLGFLVAIIATALEVARGRNANYIDYSDATRLFWEGITPYTMSFVEAHGRYFLYPPAFCVLYAPVLLLPWWLGPFVWNLGNYSLFALAIKTLPKKFDKYKHRIFLFLLPILLQAVFCYQYNMVVCYIFLFAFSLMERGKGHWAAVLIMVSATTKIYGGIEIAMLLMYAKPWRNIAVAVVSGAILIALPMVNTNFASPMGLYEDMANILSTHNSAVDYVGILYARGLKWLLRPNHYAVQGIVLALLAVLFFVRRARWSDFRFRTQCLAGIMGFVVLFSDCPETHTYIIPIAGYLLAFWLQPNKGRIDWILFWLLFVNFAILPTDVLCPAKVHEFIHETFWLDVYVYTICWLRILWWAWSDKGEPCNISVKTETTANGQS